MPAHKWANIQTERKSSSAKDDVIFIAGAVFVTYLICTIFKVLLFPFRLLFVPHNYEQDIEKAKEKVKQRKIRRIEISKDPTDPLNRFKLTFKTDDPEAVEWHRLWKAGKVLDPELRWAPEVYVDHRLNMEFLRYFEYQMCRIQKSYRSARWLFRRTVKRYYPEFSSEFNQMAKDLEVLKDRATARQLAEELKSEIRKLGVSEDIASYLAEANLEPEEIKRRAKYIKICTERGFSKKATLWLAEHGEENGISAGSRAAERINFFVDKEILPELALASARGDVTDEELAEIGNQCRFFKQNISVAYDKSPTGSGKTNYDEYQMGLLEGLLANKSGKDIKAVWEKPCTRKKS